MRELQASYRPAVQTAAPEMTFGAWLDFWYRTYSKPGLRPKSQEFEENYLYKHIIPSIGDIPLPKLQQTDIQKFYADLKEHGRLIHVEKFGPGLSDRAVRACHTICHSALQKAVEQKLLAQNPATGCKLPPKKSQPMQVLTHDEMTRFLIQSKADDFYELALLELSTGMRRGEICALQWKDLNFRTGELQIRRQAGYISGTVQVAPLKTNSSRRSLILPEPVVQVLHTRKKQSSSPWMFPSPSDESQPCDPRNIYRTMKKILKRAQCKDVRFHDLRHTFATTALENGLDIKTLSVIIGHVSAATTVDVYSHVTNAMQLAAAEKIERGFGGVGACEGAEAICTGEASVDTTAAEKAKFEPFQGKRRKSGRGGVYRINDHLFEGRYTPTEANDKRKVHTVYAKTEAECE